jgi:uncharacterized membrane protein
MKAMEKLMKYLQYILLGLVVFVHPIMPSIVLVGLSLFSFRKHDWQEGFFDDRWGILGSVSFLVGIIIYLVMVYLPSQA